MKLRMDIHAQCVITQITGNHAYVTVGEQTMEHM